MAVRMDSAGEGAVITLETPPNNPSKEKPGASSTAQAKLAVL